MMEYVTQRWIDVVQAVGIISGIVFSGHAHRTDARERRAQRHFELTREHREIWEDLNARSVGKELLSKNRDLAARPRTIEETEAVRTLTLHLNAFFRSETEGIHVMPERVMEDIQDFFSHPVPRDAWREVRDFHDRAFVAFVESAFVRS